MEHIGIYIVVAVVLLFGILLLSSLTKMSSDLSRQEELEDLKRVREAQAREVDYSEFAETE